MAFHAKRGGLGALRGVVDNFDFGTAAHGVLSLGVDL